MENKEEELKANLKVENMESSEKEFRTIINKQIEIGVMKNLHWFIKKNESLYRFILDKTEFLNILSYEIIISQRVWHIYHNIIEIPACQECGKEVKFYRFSRGYKYCCSIKCGYGKVAHQKMLNTNFNNNGDKNYNNREKAEETCMALYKVKHPAQNGEIQEKMVKNYRKYKDYTMPSGKILKIQGHENITIDWLLTIFNEEDIFIGNNNIGKEIGQVWYKQNNKDLKYFPDAFVKSINKVFETKSPWIYDLHKEKNLLKKQATIDKGVNFEFVIWDKKFNLIDEY